MTESNPSTNLLRSAIPTKEASMVEAATDEPRPSRRGRQAGALASVLLVAACSSGTRTESAPQEGEERVFPAGSVVQVVEYEPHEPGSPQRVVTIKPSRKPGSTAVPRAKKSTVPAVAEDPAEVEVMYCPPKATASLDATSPPVNTSASAAPEASVSPTPLPIESGPGCYSGDITRQLWDTMYPPANGPQPPEGLPVTLTTPAPYTVD